MNCLKVSGICLGLSVCGLATAEDSGVYVGAGVGLAHEEFTGFNGSDVAFKAVAGYSFNKYFSVEASYADGGTQKDDIGGMDVAISSDGFIGAILAKWPVTDRFSPYLKVGYAFYDTEIKVTGGPTPISDSASESDSMVGGGLEFKLGDRFRLRADLDRINVPDAAYRIYSLMATYSF